MKRDILGVPVDAITLEAVLARVEWAIARRAPLRIGVVNAAKLVNMRTDAGLRASVVESDLVLADGMSIVLAARLLGAALPERVTGIDLMAGMLRRAAARGWRVYCLGASEAVLRAAMAKMAEENPGLVLAGGRHGYFDDADEPAVAAEIAAARPDILLVAMTSPKKERFLARWSATIGASVCHGVGGSFDVLAGKVRRAPPRWQRLGLEWLYRVCQEPRRLWRRYLVANAAFCGLVLADIARRPFRA